MCFPIYHTGTELLFCFCVCFLFIFITIAMASLINKVCVCVCVLIAQSCPTLCKGMDYSPPRFLCPWDFSGKGTRVGCHFLLQGIFPTQGWNLDLLHCRQILYCLSHQGSPRIKHEWLLYNKKVKQLFILIY